MKILPLGESLTEVKFNVLETRVNNSKKKFLQKCSN